MPSKKKSTSKAPQKERKKKSQNSFEAKFTFSTLERKAKKRNNDGIKITPTDSLM